MEVGRAYATAIPVPDDLAGCSKAAAAGGDGGDEGGALMEDAVDEYLRSA